MEFIENRDNPYFNCTIYGGRLMKTLLSLLMSVLLFSSMAFAGSNEEGFSALAGKDYPKALNLFQQGAKQGNAEAEYQMALMFEKGQGIRKNESQACYWYEQAASHGSARAQFALGFLHTQGQLKPLNFMEAARLFEQAARQGDAEAQYHLGQLYEKGRGVPQDYDKAARWYKKAARQDYVLAQNALGFLYYNGKGVPRDLVISLALFNIAAARGNADAFQNSYIAASNMPFKNFDKAKYLASDRKQLYSMIGW
jgi:TPR repeat protein